MRSPWLVACALAAVAAGGPLVPSAPQADLGPAFAWSPMALGDEGLYARHYTNESGASADPQAFLRFSWPSTRPIPRGEAIVQAPLLTTSTPEQGLSGDSATWAFDPGTRDLAAWGERHEKRAVPDADLGDVLASTTTFDARGAALPPCWLLPVWQTSGLRSGEPFRLGDGCAWSDLKPQASVWRRVAQRGSDILVSGRLAEGPATLWLQSANPYPIQIVLDAGPRGSQVIEMTHFRRGSNEIQWTDNAVDGAALVWEAGDLGPSTKGIAHPFGPDEALAAVAADPAYRRFTEAVAASGLSYGHYHLRDDTGFVDHTWILGSTEGSQDLAVQVVRSIRPTVTADPLAVHSGTYTEAIGIAWVTLGVDLAPAGDLPWPTVASLWSRWKLFAGPAYEDSAPNAWGFAHSCPVTDCSDPELSTWAGVNAFVRVQDSAAARLPWGFLLPGTQSSLRSLVEGTWKDGRERLELQEWTDIQEIEPLPQGGAPAEGDPHQQWAAVSQEAATWTRAAVTVGLVGTALAAVMAVWPKVQAVSIGLFSKRVEAAAALESPVRRRIFDAIQAEPGIHIRELGRRVGLGRNQVDHHLLRLRLAGLVTTVRKGRYRLAFPATAAGAERAARAAATRSKGARLILDLLAACPGLSGAEIARRTGLSEATVSYHLRRIRDSS